jgi:ribosome-associated protein
MNKAKGMLPDLDKSTALQAIETALHAMLLRKADDIRILDLRGLSDVTDFYIVASAQSEPQVDAVSRSVIDELLELGLKPHHQEGRDSLKWVLLDYFDVVVHVMTTQSREYYRLEELWNDAVSVGVTEDYFSIEDVMQRNPDLLLVKLAGGGQTETKDTP